MLGKAVTGAWGIARQLSLATLSRSFSVLHITCLCGQVCNDADELDVLEGRTCLSVRIDSLERLCAMSCDFRVRIFGQERGASG